MWSDGLVDFPRSSRTLRQEQCLRHFQRASPLATHKIENPLKNWLDRKNSCRSSNNNIPLFPLKKVNKPSRVKYLLIPTPIILGCRSIRRAQGKLSQFVSGNSKRCCKVDVGCCGRRLSSKFGIIVECFERFP